jgi:hypothetical protein
LGAAVGATDGSGTGEAEGTGQRMLKEASMGAAPTPTCAAGVGEADGRAGAVEGRAAGEEW